MDILESLAGPVFFGAIILFSLLEHWLPERPAARDFLLRWRTNLVLGALQVVLARVLFPIGVIASAAYGEALGWGLAATAAPMVAVPAGFLLLDLLRYGQHRLLHSVPLLWRVHAAHHSDPDVDFTTGLRHHPLEVVLSVLVASGFVLALGVPVASVLAYGLCASAVTFYTHANVRWPLCLERLLRTVLVTKPVHLVHHSQRRAETDSNFGNLLIVWDRVFGTFTNPDTCPQAALVLGLDTVRACEGLQLGKTLALPYTGFERPSSAIARR